MSQKLNISGINELDLNIPGSSTLGTANGVSTVTNHLTGDVTSGTSGPPNPTTVVGLQTVPVSSTLPTDQQFLQYSATGNEWIPANLPASSNGTYYLDSTASDVVGYQSLINTYPTTVEVTYTATGNNGSGDVLAAAFVGPQGGIGATLLPAGMWIPSIFLSVDSLTQSPQAVFSFYTRTSGGTETLIQQVVVNLTATAATLYDPSFELPDISVNTTDRLVIKVYLRAGGSSSRTLTLYVDGTTHNSHIHFPASSINVVYAFPLTTGAPTSTPRAGTPAFDTATNTLYVYNGTAWKSTILT